ncbi:TPA: host cell division inhibitor Icd-like protein [Salmonella enterica]|nr:host cell division inhibitor Icd-like protein [Salmonella enterica]
MATVTTTLHSEFTFHFLAARRSDLNDRPHRESVNAPDEATARRMLARDFVLVFAACIPAKGDKHE